MKSRIEEIRSIIAEKQKEHKCDYCNLLKFKGTLTYETDWDGDEKTIKDVNYCPVCGKKIEDKKGW